VESRQSVVVQVLVHKSMPESYQAQLLRALERQVNRRNPLIGWSDLYPVTGPMDLSGLEEFLDLATKKGGKAVPDESGGEDSNGEPGKEPA
jgi:hypothetical protein